MTAFEKYNNSIDQIYLLKQFGLSKLEVENAYRLAFNTLCEARNKCKHIIIDNNCPKCGMPKEYIMSGYTYFIPNCLKIIDYKL